MNARVDSIDDRLHSMHNWQVYMDSRVSDMENCLRSIEDNQVQMSERMEARMNRLYEDLSEKITEITITKDKTKRAPKKPGKSAAAIRRPLSAAAKRFRKTPN
ncbi:MAG: hypothetical protein V2I33_19305 [Kangiellaceae bacterium]|jgi:hypothetical protein|nr:hypothetical protein [Kangiellaceae bacterium]